MRPVWNNFQRSSFDYLRREQRRVSDGDDLIIIAVQNDCRDIYLLQVFDEVCF
ncbi:MAG TPA: hypothetical protein VKB86_19940 [Pyrinomonadaceae bacterium]|nr:hypothetical protein [Pyrinomonadaceae bacterium]